MSKFTDSQANASDADSTDITIENGYSQSDFIDDGFIPETEFTFYNRIQSPSRYAEDDDDLGSISSELPEPDNVAPVETNTNENVDNEGDIENILNKEDALVKKKNDFRLRSKKNYAAFFLTYSRIEKQANAWMTSHGGINDTNLQNYIDTVYTRFTQGNGTSKGAKPTKVDLVMEHHKCTTECGCQVKKDFCDEQLHFHVLLQWVTPNKDTPCSLKRRWILTLDDPGHVIPKSPGPLDIQPNIKMVQNGVRTNPRFALQP